MTKEQAALAIKLCKLAYVEQIAKAPAKRDADFRAVKHDAVHELIKRLEDMAAGE